MLPMSVQTLILQNELERMRGPFSEPGDAYEAWFKVEKPTVLQRRSGWRKLDASEAWAALDELRVNAYRDVILRSAGYEMPARTSVESVFAAVQSAAALAPIQRRGSDPAEPEPADQQPKPRPNPPSCDLAAMQELFRIRNMEQRHELALRAAEVALACGRICTGPAFVQTYIDAQAAVLDSW